MQLAGRRSFVPAAVRLSVAGLVLGAVVAAAAAPDPRPLLERRLEGHTSLVQQLMTAAQLASTVPGLAAEERARIERMSDQGMALVGAGRDGAATRTFYRAIAAGLGREWTPRDEYARSLELEARPTVADSSEPIRVELRQVFDVDWVPEKLLAVRASLVPRQGSSPPVALGSFDGIAADLVRWPWTFDLPPVELADGAYRVRVEVLEGAEGGNLRRVEAPLVVVHGLESARLEVERRLAGVEARPDTASSVRYPFALARYVDLGRVEVGRYDFGAGIARSRAILDSLERGVDPLYRATGDLERHYFLEQAGEIIPYALIVPESYDGSRPFPLVVAFHGGGGDQDTMMRPGMRSLARRYGMIVVSPMGYRPDGGFGTVAEVRPSWAGPARIHRSQIAELDALAVIDRVEAEYRIDEDRVYLVGHSGGGGAAWLFGSLYPARWAAVSPISTLNTLEPDELERMRRLPVMLTHGDADLVAPLETPHLMMERMRALGMSFEYVEIPGASHDSVDQALPGVFEFLSRQRRGSAYVPPAGGDAGNAGRRGSSR